MIFANLSMLQAPRSVSNERDASSSIYVRSLFPCGLSVAGADGYSTTNSRCVDAWESYAWGKF